LNINELGQVHPNNMFPLVIKILHNKQILEVKPYIDRKIQ